MGAWTILFSLKGYPLPQEICISYIMTQVSSLCFCVLIYFLFNPVCLRFSPTGRGRPALFNGWGRQHWSQSDSKLRTSGEGTCWRVGRQPRWPEICRESGGLWTKERRNPRSPPACVCAGIGHVDGERGEVMPCLICTDLSNWFVWMDLMHLLTIHLSGQNQHSDTFNKWTVHLYPSRKTELLLPFMLLSKLNLCFGFWHCPVNLYVD